MGYRYRKRTISMDQIAERKMLVDFLNYNRGKPIYRRIVKLIDAIGAAREATPLIPSLRELFLSEAKSRPVPAVSWEEIRQINGKLRRYMSWPRIVGRRKVGGRSKNRQRQSRLIWRWWPKLSVGPIVYAIARLEQQGQFDFLRRCEECNEKWLFTCRRQRFCSAECRGKNHRRTDEGRRKRRDYMRKYRAQPSERGKK